MSIAYFYGFMSSRDIWVLSTYMDLWVLEIFEFYRYIWDPGIHEF